jgi:hypothetical protein
MVADLILRFVWTLSIIPTSQGNPFIPYLTTFLSPVIAAGELCRWGGGGETREQRKKEKRERERERSRTLESLDSVRECIMYAQCGCLTTFIVQDRQHAPLH